MWTGEHRGRSAALQYPARPAVEGYRPCRFGGSTIAALVTREDGNEAVGIRAPEVREPPDGEQIADDGRLASHFRLEDSVRRFRMAEWPRPHARILVEAVRVRNMVDPCDLVSTSL